MQEEALLDFARRSVRSVWALELLLLMRRSAPRRWAEDELVASLHASAQVVSDSLRVLAEAGLVRAAQDGLHEYWPETPELARAADALNELHQRKPVTLVGTILSAPNERIRTFANAFRFKKRPDG